MTARAVVVLLFIGSNAVAQAGGGMQTSGQNSVADLLQEQGLLLGIDFDRDNAKASHPAAEEVRALGRAGVGAWLNSEIEQPDDSISEPPAALRDYLSDHREAIWNIVAALEKGFPDWGHRPNEVLWPTLTLLPTIMLERVLLVSALREAREGRPIDAERALEASWSLRAPVALPGNLLACLTAGHIGDWEGGVLRKMKASPVQWMTRMSGEKPWVELLDAFLEDVSDRNRSALTEEPIKKAYRRAMSALVDALRKMSPCDAARLPDEEMWAPAARQIDPNPQILNLAEFLQESIVPQVSSAVRRTAREVVGRELTLKILELRLEKAGASNHAWPKKLEAFASEACPGVTYAYSAGSGKMEIRFEGTIEAPEHGPVLPLEFRSGNGREATTTATAAPTTTPTPEAP